MPFGKFRHPAQQYAVGTEDPAVGPGIEHSQEKKGDAQENHQEGAVHSEDPHKGIVAANNKITPGGCKQHRKCQVDHRDKSQGFPDPAGHGYRVDHQQVLYGSQRTGRGTEDPSEKEGKQQGQKKKEQRRDGDGISGSKMERATF